ncbi:hypothetical protein LINPERPRIM_LOCUS31254 [Linum perenne]
MDNMDGALREGSHY